MTDEWSKAFAMAEQLLRTMAEAERQQRDAARKDGREEIALMHGDRAIALDAGAAAIGRLIPLVSLVAS